MPAILPMATPPLDSSVPRSRRATRLGVAMAAKPVAASIAADSLMRVVVFIVFAGSAGPVLLDRSR